MSGICGIVTFAAGQPDPTELEPVLEQLKRRGPDGANVWIGESVALGHALLATTPEAVVEKLPLHHEPSGCTITADVRLDNRDELLATLGTTNAGRVIGDGELILLAYLKWGDDCACHLRGDFAFAIWDSRDQRLFCARDQMGMRQLAYSYRPGAPFTFATEPAAVLQHPSVPKDLNPGRIADFLDDLEGLELSETFYAAISRLEPAHTLIVTAEGIRLRKYWRLQTSAVLTFRSDEECAEAFLDVFRAAVGCRLRASHPVAAMLSGGMDSSSVAAVAAEVLAREDGPLLPTFSAVSSEPATCLETRAIQAASQIMGIEPHFVSPADLEPYRAELTQLTKAASEPFDAHMTMIRALYLTAHRTGIRVVLDGVGGDIVLGSGGYVARLLRGGRLMQAWREARGEHSYWGPGWPAWRAFAAGAWQAWAPGSIRAARREAAAWRRDREIGRKGLISKEFAQVVDLRRRRQRLRARNTAQDQIDGDEATRRIAQVNLIVGRERYDRVASSMAVEPRDPFMDLRVIDFCLATPWQQMQSQGLPKMLLRRAMAGRVPDAVRWRRGKEHLGWAFTAGVFAREAATDLHSGRFRETLAPYIDLARLEDGSAHEHCEEWLDALYLYHWLAAA